MPVFDFRIRTVAAASVPILALSLAQAGQPADQTLDTVVVSAQRLQARIEAERAATPGAVTILDAATFNERSVAQVADMLRYVPGVFAESYNGNDDVFYSSRGSNLDATDYDKNGVKFLQDGLPLTTADGNNHNRALDPMIARYVTIAHGANALAYGASTLGGAIDVTSSTARTTPTSASLSGGSFGQWSARGTLGGFSGTLDGLLSGETLQRDGYRDHAGEDRRSLHGNIGWQATEEVSARFYAMYNDIDVELPRELTRAQFRADPRQARADAISGDHGKKVQSWRVALKTMMELAGGTLELGASHEEQALYHPIVSLPFFSLLIDTDHKDSGAVLRYGKSAGGHGMMFGANYARSTAKGGNYENDGGERGAFKSTADDSASMLELFALDRWNFAPRWTLVYGTQFVAAERDVGRLKGNYNSFNPRLGVILNLDEGSEWYASLSRIYEAPTTFELLDEASGNGTPLDAMHGVVAETGLRGTAMRGDTGLNWDFSSYYTALRNEILSIDDDPSAPGTSLSANMDKTTHAGIEALFGASFAVGEDRHRIEPLVSGTFNAFSFDSHETYGNKRLPSAPRWFARGEVMYANVSGFRVGPTFDFVGPRYVDFDNSYRVGSYGLLGARASFNSGRWDIYAEARNLLDKEYIATVVVRDRAGPDAEVLFPGAPRSVYFGARYQF